MQIIKGKLEKPVKGLVYGPQGVGKSSLAKDMPKPIFIDVEGGTTRLDVDRTPTPTSWAHMRQIVGELAKDQMGYETLVFDTSDWMERLAIRQVLAETGSTELGKDASGKKDWGKSYQLVAELWASFLTQLETDFIDARKMHVIFLAHSNTKRYELPEEDGEFDKYQLKMSDRVGALIKEWCELMLFVNYRTIVVTEENKKAKAQGGTRRIMYSDNRASFEAKNRFGLPGEMDLGIGPIKHCFVGIAPKAAPAPVVPNAPMAAATPADAPIAAPNPPINPVAMATPETGCSVGIPPMPEPAPVTGPVLQPQHVALQQLLAGAGVTYEQLNAVLAARGKYPEGTPLGNIDTQFIEGYINPHWAKILEVINSNAAAA